jgi:hypothetical protein
MNKVKCRICTIQSIVQIISDYIDTIKLCGVKGQKKENMHMCSKTHKLQSLANKQLIGNEWSRTQRSGNSKQ